LGVILAAKGGFLSGYSFMGKRLYTPPRSTEIHRFGSRVYLLHFGSIKGTINLGVYILTVGYGRDGIYTHIMSLRAIMFVPESHVVYWPHG